MRYSTAEKVAAGFRVLTAEEIAKCEALLDEAGVIIDLTRKDAPLEAKEVVSNRMVRRALGTSADVVPIGATQGTVSALSYSQSWTMQGGSNGEIYLSSLEKRMLGVGNRIGSYSPVEVIDEGHNS